MSDLISREELMKLWDEYHPYIAVKAIEFGNALKEIPSAEPVRHGKFIGTEFDGYADGNPVYYEWKCSECGCIFEEDEPMYRYRYCPYCGARMDKE